jgi:hypothetical protein
MTDDSVFPEDLPTTLDQIVRRNRDLLSIGLATAAELAAVTGDVDTVGAPRGRIDDWRVTALRHRAIALNTLHVLGRYHDSRSWLTSNVAVISSDQARVRTRNSVYLLGRPATGEPDVRLLLHIAFVLRWWGLDQRYDLGVVPVLYG